MGTRGFIGFAVDGEVKVGYNHSDSYPEGLGVDMLKWLRDADHDAAREAARTLRVVAPDSEPADKDIEHLSRFLNSGVGTPRERPDWYQLLRETQGDPGAILDAGVIESAADFPADSLFAEWGYVVDFDANTLEVYEGFQHSPHNDGRFATMSGRSDGYYPVRLIKTWSLAELPSDEEFVAEPHGKAVIVGTAWVIQVLVEDDEARDNGTWRTVQTMDQNRPMHEAATRAREDYPTVPWRIALRVTTDEVVYAPSQPVQS